MTTRATLLIWVLAVLTAWTTPAPAARTQDGPTPVERPAAAALERVEGLDDPGVEIEDGVVTITGVADDPEVIERATEAVRAVPGVGEVRNEITLTDDYGDRVRGAASRVSQRYARLLSILPLIPVAIAVILLALGIAWLVGRWAWPFGLLTANPFLRSIAQRLAQTIVVILGVLLALELLDATALVGGVLGAAGVAGIAIGFAFRDLIENYIASVLLSVRQPFRPRDHVVIDGHEGLVTSMNSRTTVLTTFDGNIVRIPNALVFKSALINYTADPRRRFSFDVGIGYDVDLAQAVSVGTSVVAGTEGVMADPGPFSLITRLGESSITLQVFGWVDQSRNDFGKVRSVAMQRVKAEFDRLDIDMPEPIYRVKLERPSAPPGREPVARPAPPPEPAVHDVSRDDTAADLAQESATRSDQENLLDADAHAE